MPRKGLCASPLLWVLTVYLTFATHRYYLTRGWAVATGYSQSRDWRERDWQRSGSRDASTLIGFPTWKMKVNESVSNFCCTLHYMRVIYRIACNFRGVKISLFSWVADLDEIFTPRKSTVTHPMQCSSEANEILPHEKLHVREKRNFYPTKITRYTVAAPSNPEFRFSNFSNGALHLKIFLKG